jgi:hypothetical protein
MRLIVQIIEVWKDTYATLTDSERLFTPHLLHSTFQRFEPEIVQVTEPPVSFMLNTDLTSSSNSAIHLSLEKVSSPVVYWATFAVGKKSRDDHIRP